MGEFTLTQHDSHDNTAIGYLALSSTRRLTEQHDRDSKLFNNRTGTQNTAVGVNAEAVLLRLPM